MSRATAQILITCFGLGMGACTQFPDLDSTQTAEIDAAAYPALVPLEPLLAQAQTTGPDPVQTQGALDARLSALRARANGLRGTVLTNAEKERLRAGLR
ncbi:hypothetical protein Z946_3393 [Sulfitobacter noctilucicola]|uniref:Uncharacterized protein n=1 Tax=Sulfitobacter noctilucicola TaxID=1342301 RepID=A0A7W6Q611_9RHOB|nr:hypothetical protein [Sulfitobacter noctilucicola]KIN64501.1 hypothetical protein Z946_3393 [Sulfitobacter noctilucicola]MBB4174340.1 hypothetical protein [Sulfitobacter noctilucicola]